MYSSNDVKQFALRAVQGMIESTNSMAEDPDYNIPTGDITDEIRGQAIDFVRDMVADFEFEIIEAIKTMKFRAERTITFTVGE